MARASNTRQDRSAVASPNDPRKQSGVTHRGAEVDPVVLGFGVNVARPVCHACSDLAHALDVGRSRIACRLSRKPVQSSYEAGQGSVGRGA
jgi:hypothetical protein